MVTKPPFDPRIHLLDDDRKPSAVQRRTESNDEGRLAAAVDNSSRMAPSSSSADIKPQQHGHSTDVDDETIARILHEQMMEEERLSRTTGLRGVVEDEEYARLMQHQEQQEGGSLNSSAGDLFIGGDSFMPVSEKQRQSGITSQIEYARRMQAQALYDVRKGAGSAPPTTARNAEDDIEWARHLQEIESIEQNAARPRKPYDSGDSLDYQRAIAESEAMYGAQDHQVPNSQEDEDARLARIMWATGESLRNLDENQKPSACPAPMAELTEQEEEDARIARMMQETGDSFRNLDLEGIGVSPPAAQAPAPSRVAESIQGPTAISLPDKEQIMSSPQKDSPTYRSAPTSPPLVSNDAPPGVQLPSSEGEMDNIMSSIPLPKEKEKKKLLGLLNFKRKQGEKGNTSSASPPMIPAPIPPPPQKKRPGPLPYSESVSRDIAGGPASKDAELMKKKVISLPGRQQTFCFACSRPASTYVIALDKKYHLECFRCVGCHQIIDPSSKFAFKTDPNGHRFPLHGACYEELYGVKCAVCRQSIPAGPDGKVSYVKHPFFDTEQMCPRHATNPGRRCTGCHRFEPEDHPFADLDDSGRCVCFSCCRTVVVDSADAEPLWQRVIEFFENSLGLPVWPDMAKVPVLVVGYEALNNQMMEAGGAHGGSTQIMTRGLCLTEHQSGRRLKLSRMRFDQRSGSFQKQDLEDQGFTYFRVPDPNKVNPDASVTCILCLSGLPADLTASVLAHEATHAWIKLHPNFDVGHPIPPKVEEGVAQLVAMLFLTEGLDSPSTDTHGEAGPTQEKLRQYFKFSIETDDNEIYGEGYRRAARAYADIGIEALLSHIILYQEFPET